jgi:hypothetical protein
MTSVTKKAPDDSDIVEIRSTSLDDVLQYVRFMRGAAEGQCTANRYDGETCLNVGSSDWVAFCNRCIAKEAIQAICFELEVVDMAHITSAKFAANEAIARLHRLSEISDRARSLPWNGYR